MSAPSKESPQIFGMTLGAEPKKIGALVGLLLVLGIVYFVMRDPSGSSPSAAQQSGSTAKAPAGLKSMGDPEAIGGRPPMQTTRRDSPGGPRRQGSRQALSGSVKEFKVSLKPDKENPIDPSRTDPTIRFASLAKVQGVGMAGGGRSLFDFGSMTQLAEGPKPGVIVKPTKVIPVYGPPILGPLPQKPPDPPPPAIPLKFYGFVHTARSGERRAFFMENEDIYIASEGEMIKKRYKLVKIGVNSAVLEDSQFKNNQQTIKLETEAQSTTP
jgi:hypothetical protein